MICFIEGILVEGVHGHDGHLDDGFDGGHVVEEDILPIEHEDLEGFEGLAELLLIGRIEQFGDDVEHLELIFCDGLAFLDEGHQHHEDIFLEVGLVSVDVLDQGEDGILYFRNHFGDEPLIFADSGDDVP